MNAPRSNVGLLRQGVHCRGKSHADSRGFIYPLRRSNFLYRAFNERFLESGIQDANVYDESAPVPVAPWWTIEIAGFEIVNDDEFSLESDLFRAPEQAWQPQASPVSDAPAFATRHTHLKARIWWMNNTGSKRWVDVDIGHGSRFSVQSDQVFAGLLVPPDALPVAQGTRETTTIPDPRGDDPIAQALIVGSVVPSPFAPDSGQIATNTIVVDIPQGATTIESGIGIPTPAIKIPPFAKRVQICQNGGALLPLSFITGVQRVNRNTWTIPPNAVICPIVLDATTFSTGLIDIPQHASHIGLPAVDMDDLRTLTLVFELDIR